MPLFSEAQRRFLATLLRGQLISVLIAGTGFFASLLSSSNVSVPIFLMFVNYLCLAPFLLLRDDGERGFYFSSRAGRRAAERVDVGGDCAKPFSIFGIALSCPWWLYALIAVVDLEANVLVISAYRYTSVTSVMLLDCFSIPCVMLLSYFFLQARYNARHLVGTIICLMGMACIVVSDSIVGGGSQQSSNPLYGDVLCLVGTSLYACSNVMQEKLVKHKDREEYLGMLGAFGSCCAAIQFAVMEAEAVWSIRWSGSTIGFTLGFVFCLNFMYTRASSYLQHSDAALLNLSLLTSDVYAVLFSFFVYSYLVSWLYFLAFGLACTGLIIYSTAQSPTASMAPAVDGAGDFSSGGIKVVDEPDQAFSSSLFLPYHSLPPHDYIDSLIVTGSAKSDQAVNSGT